VYPNQLIGKPAIRKEPVIITIEENMEFDGRTMNYKRQTPDYSYTRYPIVIIAATDAHILYLSFDEVLMGKNPIPSILNKFYVDDGWYDYSDLIDLATRFPQMAELMKGELK